MSADDLAALLAFYAQRLDEDEAMARRNTGEAGLGDDESPDGWPGYPDYQTYSDDDTEAADEYIRRFRPLRGLREIAAKRAFLAWYTDAAAAAALFKEKLGTGDHMEVAAESYLNVIKANATAWSDHPGYRAAWAPPHYHAEQAT